MREMYYLCTIKFKNKEIMTDNERFYLSMLRQYFVNIKCACENEKVDERAYIKGVAESGLFVIKENLKL